MILRGYYLNSVLYAQYDFRLYRLVFEHNYTKSNCFKDEIEARRTNDNGKFSILYDLDNPKYVMKDGFRHFIIDYPSLNLLNTWKQKKSPLQDIEKKDVFTATGFEAGITEAPSKEWGGLVKTASNPDTFLDGLNRWFYSVGMYCNALDWFKNKGLPAYYDTSEHTTDKMRLWCAIKDYSIGERYSCVHRLYYSMLFIAAINIVITVTE
ncbi:hypothetical protein TVAG_394890 [Trichomonas vaginalis G3]|uniref:Uncharacterized protein n=1 Tax=Trichomonas vaginalis (strain ATCC PRA-98 / G3) TaxID=412133 RepID=A2EDF3_TRIV3|nr:hypothetical protein TVAGG3_0725160 [Trichomonas vaginalis G3]EAY09317.1 hypothetical protein TVAG_394890 [Trichomonas vaginalis G3]KAI5510854.1 hypothetical protein TVAGG3_0725160 [Trichomonas vaginalis G3]|eukprot:XP_001321540.1 hypothetical protein [Trichomonas vaginalis G3]